MINHILVPLDGSVLAECSLPHLSGLAKVGDPRVTLLRVMDPQQDEPGFRRPLDPFDWQMRKVEAETYLNRVAERLAQVGIEAEVALVEGRAAEMVLEYCQMHQCDLILLSSHGQSGLSEWNVSGVVQKIILRARTSIMIVRAYQAVQGGLADFCYQRILLPLDGSGRSEAAVPLASAIARAHGASIIAAHVVHEPELPRRILPSQEDLQLAAQLVARNRAEAAAYLEEVAGRMDAQIETRLLVEGDVAAAIQHMAETEQVDLVILSAHGYTGGTRVPYGSVGLSFIAYGSAPLLVIQDLAPERLEPTRAELIARERGGR